MTLFTIVAAKSDNDIIGVEGQLPWNLKDDLKHFSKLTRGHTVVMGRKTFESIGKPLPKRRNIVLTTNPDWKAEGVETFWFYDTKEIIELLHEEEVFVIGGGRIYELLAPICDRAIITKVSTNIDVDTKEYTRMPLLYGHWKNSLIYTQLADDRNDYSFQIWEMKRQKPPCGSF